MASLSFPTNPTNGQIYLGPNNVRYMYHTSSSSWSTTLTTDASLHGANPGPTPPTGALIGTLWLDTDTNILFVRKVVGGIGEWVAINGSGGSSSAAAGISLEGVAYYDGNIETDVGINLELQPEA